jgi:ABC-type transporter Mla subunit MlaD
MTGRADESFGALAQAWSDSLQRLLTDQTQSSRAALEALSSTLAATEQALASQEESNRALRKSLTAYREVLEQAGATQERSARLIQAALESFAATTQAQLELTKAFMAPMGAAQPEAFGTLVQGWNDAFLRLLEAAPGRSAPGGPGDQAGGGKG